MILPSDIRYQPFSDAQCESFARAAGSDANGDTFWRDELNNAAHELLIESCADEWPTPSEMVKDLERIAKNPDEFIGRLEVDSGIMDSPVVTAILHGTRWTPDRLATVAAHREEFIAGVAREVAFLRRIVERRKATRICGNRGNAAMAWFVERLAWIFTDAFLKTVNEGLTVPYGGGVPKGPFIGFAKAVVSAIESNLHDSLRAGDLPAQLRCIAQDTSTAIWNRLTRTDCYALARDTRKTEQKSRI